MKLKLLFALLIVQLGFAQHRTCGMEQEMARIMADPQLKQEYLDRQAKFQVEYDKLLAKEVAYRNGDANVVNSPAVTIRIPVAVHYPTAGAASAAVKTCLRTLAQNQINILNADYNAANADLSLWTGGASAFYPGVTVGNLDVQFVLATLNHPAGTGLVNGDVAVTFGTDFTAGDTDTTWSGYMNFVVKNLGSGLLGYSPLAGSPSAGQTVVMDNNAFASGSGCTGFVPGAPFNLGRTVTHELGHFFNLNHTFGNGTGCPTSDGVADTPQVGEPTYQCPANGSVAGCVSGQDALTMNYMDYTDDACMYMFTNGQKTRALAYINSISSQFLTNVLGNDDFVKNNFSIYPNPNNGSFTIQLGELVDNYSVQIYDSTGRVIIENEYNQTSELSQTIKMDSPSTGVYFVSIKSNDGVAVKKIIVE